MSRAGPTPTGAQALPAGACDTHVHVFDPARFPYAEGRSYTPPSADVATLRAQHAQLGIARTVLVQPSVYGSDNRCLLDALHQLGSTRARGIAVLDEQRIEAGALVALHGAGVRGVRLNLEVSGEARLDAIRARLRALRWLQDLPGWSLQIHASLALIAQLADALAQLGVPVVLDHFAGALKAEGAASPELAPVLALMRAGTAHVKLSAAYRRRAGCSDAEVAALVRTFHAAAPSALLWGSDWPHTGGTPGQWRDPRQVEPLRAIDNAAALAQLRAALPDDLAWQQVLIANPARLYGFDTPQETA